MAFPSTVVANVKGPFSSRAGHLHSLEKGPVAELLEIHAGKEMNLERTSDMRNRNKTRVHQFSVSFANLMNVIAMLFGIDVVLICKVVTIKKGSNGGSVSMILG
jgi:hypothetical protein